jgi:hypothetical protein
MFIVRVHDWNTDEITYVGVFTTRLAVTVWINEQAKNDNEDIDYEICPLETPVINNS